jgi:cell division septal protein FtsQ
MGWLRRRNRRRQPLGERLGAAARATAGGVRGLLKLALVMGLLVGVPLGLYQGYMALMRSDYFVLSALHLEGHQRLSRDEVLLIAGLDGRRNIFTVDADRIAQRLRQNPWITEAEVELDLPRTARIRIVEREPAGWLFAGTLYRVDTDGFVIEPGTVAELQGPLITGLEPTTRAELGRDELANRRGFAGGRVRQALDLARSYEAALLPRVDALAEIHYDELMGFSLLTQDHGIEVRLGHDRFEERLERLRDVLLTLEGRELGGRYVLLDGDLSRVAVGPPRPGRGEGGPTAHDAPLVQ